LIDYYLAEDTVLADKDEATKLLRLNEPSYYQVIRDTFKSEKRLKKVSEIKTKIGFGNLKLNLVTSPLALIELIDWYTEASFKQISSEVVGSFNIQRLGKKELGNILKNLTEKIKTNNEVDSKSLMMNLYLHSEELHESLYGILFVDVMNFNLSFENIWREIPYAFALLQLGVADIMHILIAKHIGCKYFASFDSDFQRVRDLVERGMGIEILTTPEEILKILESGV